jgi:hypothetical protein
MSMTDGEVEVEVSLHDIGDITDTNSGPPPAPVAKKSAEDAGRTVEPGAVELKSQLDKMTRQRDENQRRADTEARGRADAEARAKAASDEAEAAKTGSVDAQRLAIDNAITANQAALDSAKKSLAAAWAEGKFEDAADIQATIAANAAEIAQLKAGKMALGTPDTTTGRVEKKPDARPSEDEKFNRYISQFSPVAQRWLRDHPDAVTNPDLNAKLIRAHHVAEDQGLEKEGPEYFRLLEEKLGYIDPGGGDDVDVDLPRRSQQERQPVARQTVARQRASAPVRGSDSGSGRANGNGSDTMRVKLSQGEREAATDGTLVWNHDDKDGRFKKGDPIGLNEYARRKVALEKAGRYKNTDA